MKADKLVVDKTELHSEKVRLLMEELPTSVVLWGIVIIAVVFIALIAALCLLPYPYSNGETIIWHILGIYDAKS